ncbi:MAG: hypothetical protein LBI17_02465, partial [Rickettsiales bacterium]|nr:hypothetical protein [Rickettsiales bacterium]
IRPLANLLYDFHKNDAPEPLYRPEMLKKKYRDVLKEIKRDMAIIKLMNKHDRKIEKIKNKFEKSK